MIVNYREKMKEYLKEPNEICNRYGKWGILNREQRNLITRLLDEMDRSDNYIKKLQQENSQLKDKIEKVIDYANSDEFEQLFESCANFNEANCNINHFLKEN